MRLRFPTRDIPSRLATGAFVLHAGIEKWKGAPELAAGVHGMAAGAFPFLRRIPPTAFLRLLAASEIATGALLLPPIVPNAVAGAPLTAFSASLLAMYLRTEALHKPGSVWPTPAGIALSKDIWMLGTGLTLLLDQAGTRRSTSWRWWRAANTFRRPTCRNHSSRRRATLARFWA